MHSDDVLQIIANVFFTNNVMTLYIDEHQKDNGITFLH